MVVDDEEHTCEILKRSLEKAGYEVLTFGKGKEALKRVEKGGVDLVLLDMRLKDINGLEVLEEIKKRISPRTVVIMITGYASLGTMKKATALGAYDYVIKPLDLDFVKELVEGALQEQEASG